MDLAVPHVAGSAEISVDAHRNEAAWNAALPLPDPFVVVDPSPGAAPAAATRAWILSDDRALYLLIEADDPQPQQIRAAIGPRDSRTADDLVGLYLDTTGEAQRAYEFAVTARGVQLDGIRVASDTQDDLGWNGWWSAASRITERGFVVEIAIPWRTVLHPRDCEHLGLRIFRQNARFGELSAWPAVDPDVAGLLVQQARMGGPGRLPPVTGLDLLPELTWRWSDAGAVATPVSYEGLSPGLTARWTPGPRTSLLATANPDFSDVVPDAPQIGVNQRFALHYDERRPFFLDGQEWFTHPFGELLYTRSIVAPLVGERATGEWSGGTAAVLHAIDTTPLPSLSEGGGWSEEDLEGRWASDAAARVRVDVGRDGQVGVLLSDKSIVGTDLYNRLGGVDANVRMSDRVRLWGSALVSATTFSDAPAAVAPAANGHVEYASRSVVVGTEGGRHHARFRAENGYVTRSDQVHGKSWLSLVAHPPSAAVPQIAFLPVNVYYGWTTSGTLRDLGASGPPTSRSATGWPHSWAGSSAASCSRTPGSIRVRAGSRSAGP
ncbi:MAG: sugar-binding protein [Myxococcota bacterium]